MRLIAVAHSLPMLDMTLALIAQLRRERVVSHVTTVVKLTGVTQSPDIRFLCDTIVDLSDRVIVSGENPLHEQVEAVAHSSGRPITRVRADGDLPRWLRVVRRIAPWLLDRVSIPEGGVMVRSHADVDGLSQQLGAFARAGGGRVLVSLEGCYPPSEPLPLKYFTHTRPDLCDGFLFSHPSHQEQLATVGYGEGTVIGYTKLYPAWLAYLRESGHAAALRDKSRMTVTVITRGEHPDGGPQIMPHETLERILTDVLAELALIGRPVRLLVKPHPAQDLAVLDAMLDRARPGGGDLEISIVHDYPGVLFVVSDLVVSTWSTAVIDAMAMGVPSIEYFIENDHFRSVYPGGSSFRKLGIAWCEDREGFARALRGMLDGTFAQPDAGSALDQQMDLTVFGVDQPPVG